MSSVLSQESAESDATIRVTVGAATRSRRQCAGRRGGGAAPYARKHPTQPPIATRAGQDETPALLAAPGIVVRVERRGAEFTCGEYLCVERGHRDTLVEDEVLSLVATWYAHGLRCHGTFTASDVMELYTASDVMELCGARGNSCGDIGLSSIQNVSGRL